LHFHGIWLKYSHKKGPKFLGPFRLGYAVVSPTNQFFFRPFVKRRESVRGRNRGVGIEGIGIGEGDNWVPGLWI
jgi:hypothetical protein